MWSSLTKFSMQFVYSAIVVLSLQALGLGHFLFSLLIVRTSGSESPWICKTFSSKNKAS